MRKQFLLLVLLSSVALSFVTAQDFWSEREEKGSGDEILERQQQEEENQFDMLKKLTVEETEAGKLNLNNPLEPDSLLSGAKRGPMNHVMLQAFDTDGDGLLSGDELGKINKKAWLNFHKSMTGRVLSAMENVVPDVKQMKEHVAARYRRSQKGEAASLGEELNGDILNGKVLQERFVKHVKHAASQEAEQAAFAEKKDSNVPQFELHKRTMEYAKQYIERNKK